MASSRRAVLKVGTLIGPNRDLRRRLLSHIGGVHVTGSGSSAPKGGNGERSRRGSQLPCDFGDHPTRCKEPWALRKYDSKGSETHWYSLPDPAGENSMCWTRRRIVIPYVIVLMSLGHGGGWS